MKPVVPSTETTEVQMEHEYEVSLECRFKRELTDLEQDLFRDALLAALDKAGLPYEVDIATAGMRDWQDE